MELNKVKLGQFIKQSDSRNSELLFGEDAVVGISTQKDLIPTKANLNGVSLGSYKIVKPNEFVYVPDTSRRGDKIALALNTTNSTFLVSSIYTVFYVDDTDRLLSDYLFMFFNRPEFDRYARTNSWGSARETFNWEDMCDIELDLPDLPTQEKYVAIYKSMQANQQSYERGLEDLKLVCDGYIEELRRNNPSQPVGQYISRVDVRNGKNGTKNVMGISTSKQFREPTSKVNRNELANYKVCKPRQIAFVQTTHNEKVFTYALNNTHEDIVVSSVNEVFMTDETHLIPEYLCMFFNRTEFDRYARFHSWGSARETFTWDDLVRIEIPIPDLNVQKSIADIYKVYIQRKEINTLLKKQLFSICPILIRGSLSDGG